MGESREKNRGSNLDKVLEPVIIDEKLEIIDKALKKVYTTLEVIANDDRVILSPDISKSFSGLTQAIYNLEKTKELLNKKIIITGRGELCKII